MPRAQGVERIGINSTPELGTNPAKTSEILGTALISKHKSEMSVFWTFYNYSMKSTTSHPSQFPMFSMCTYAHPA
jgi:hypothetical protein